MTRKLTKTTAKRKAVRKTSAPGKKEKAAPAKAVRASGTGTGAAGKKKDDETTVAARKKTSGRERTGKAGESGVKRRTAVVSAAAKGGGKTAAGQISPKGKTEGVRQKKKRPKTASTARPVKKLRRAGARASGPWIKNAGITGDLSFKKQAVKTGGVSGEGSKYSPHALHEGAEGSRNRLRKRRTGRFTDTGSVAISEIVSPVLPEEYGENEFFLIPVEPRVVYASWEITEDFLPDRKGCLDVRFFEVIYGRRGRPRVRAFLDIAISGRVGEAFFDVGIDGREIVAEIGYLGADGHFRPLLRSRTVLVPSLLGAGESDMSMELLQKGGYGSRPPDQ